MGKLIYCGIWWFDNEEKINYLNYPDEERTFKAEKIACPCGGKT